MGTHAWLTHEYVEVDIKAWVDDRTGGTILSDLNELYGAFDKRLLTTPRYSAIPTPPLDRLKLFITAHAGGDWDNAEFSELTPDTANGIVSLSQNISVLRYIDPHHGPVAFLTELNGLVFGDSCAYTDIADAEIWCAVEIQIECPNQHRWTYANGNLIEGSLHVPASVVFPGARIVTKDDNQDSPTHGQMRIICPSCGAVCDVEMNNVEPDPA